jgi:hypothetical protein
VLALVGCGSQSDDGLELGASSGGVDGGAGAAGTGASVDAGGGFPTSGGSGGASGSAGGGSAGEGSGGAAGAPVSDCPRAKVDVAEGATLNVRPTPSTSGAPVGVLADGDIVDVVAQVSGETIEGNPTWFQIQSPAVAGYISAAYSACTLETPPVVTPPEGYYLPLQCGKSAKISQGNNGGFSHSGKAKYAFDFSIAVGTPMVAMADGVVKYLYDQTGPGDACYDGGGSSCFPYANYVVLQHGDGRLTTYKHLSQVSVSLGQSVKRGAQVGLSGSTGYSTGPHAHVMKMEDCGQYNCQSIPLEFADVGGDHVPDTGQTVTSGNCP